MTEFYIDDSGLMYSSSVSTTTGEDTVSTQYVDLSLSDLGVGGSTMSTWLIDNIRWQVFVTQEDNSPLSRYVSGSTNIGIAPEGYLNPGTDDLQTPGDYQEIKGWPLKRGFQNWMLSNHGSSNFTRVSGTWTPKNNTALNRLQTVVLANNISAASDVLTRLTVRLAIHVQAKRGQ